MRNVYALHVTGCVYYFLSIFTFIFFYCYWWWMFMLFLSHAFSYYKYFLSIVTDEKCLYSWYYNYFSLFSYRYWLKIFMRLILQWFFIFVFLIFILPLFVLCAFSPSLFLFLSFFINFFLSFFVLCSSFRLSAPLYIASNCCLPFLTLFLFLSFLLPVPLVVASNYLYISLSVEWEERACVPVHKMKKLIPP